MTRLWQGCRQSSTHGNLAEAVSGAVGASDLVEIVAFIADRNTAAAQRLRDAIQACAERLPEHPFMFRPGRIEGTREAVVYPNYLLVYRVGTDSVEILNVVHARQQYP